MSVDQTPDVRRYPAGFAWRCPQCRDDGGYQSTRTVAQAGLDRHLVDHHGPMPAGAGGSDGS